MVSLIPITKSRSLDYEFNAYDIQKATINYIDNFNDTNTIFHFLKSLRNTRKFFDILSVSKLEYEYTDTILRKTLFVVPDEFFNNEIYESIVENNEYKKLIVMTNCGKGGHSTGEELGWWGSFLNDFTNSSKFAQIL